ncbi:hypothetical protein [Pseudomonas sp. XWY-1]|uniref:hypothetical protein n=1 Tax=Pseudomonas sp. XWY-1 TaxID=2069256 RepID=UPI00131A3025|nr:hypothetical protein [Pseudomonas sp. XWY-1]
MKKEKTYPAVRFIEEDKSHIYPMPIFVTRTNLRSILRENGVAALTSLDVRAAATELKKH